MDLKVLLYPADDYGCGHHRLIYPAEVLRGQGANVEVIRTAERRLDIHFQNGQVVFIDLPEGVDVFVFQRATDWRLVKAIEYMRARGLTVVVDVDDDLSAIHPDNPAWTMLDPNRARREVDLEVRRGRLNPRDADARRAERAAQYTHSWNNLIAACRAASMVTVSTPGLLRRYAARGNGHVLNNYVPDHYLDVAHTDSRLVGWPAALHSHPNDPAAVGNAIARLVADDAADFLCVGNQWHTDGDAATPGVPYTAAVARAFGMRTPPRWQGDVALADWPQFIGQLGVGIAPLADTLFNRSKSWLKLIEMSAAGVPWVASPRAEYTKVAADGVGMLAEKPRDWYRKLRVLLTDDTLRQNMSGRGREVMREKYRLADHAGRWWEAWETAWRRDHTDAPSAGTVIDTGHIINGLPGQMSPGVDAGAPA